MRVYIFLEQEELFYPYDVDSILTFRHLAFPYLGRSLWVCVHNPRDPFSDYGCNDTDGDCRDDDNLMTRIA